MKLHTEIKFDAAHFLPGYKGKCGNIHGHTWRVIVEIRGKKDEQTGMLVDFTLVKNIINEVDHKLLNSFMGNPTAENLAQYFFDEIKEAVSHNVKWIGVRVYESDVSYIEVETCVNK